MSYSALSDLQNVVSNDILIQLTDDANAGVVDTSKTTDAIAVADDTINAYCGARYDVPFSPVPDIVRTLSATLAVWRLYSRRAMQVPDAISARYKDAMSTLKDIAAGVATLGVQPSPAQTEEPATTNSDINNRVLSTGATGNDPSQASGQNINLDNY
jgi:phage gp36-like protein